jgi:hypothetical protein
MTTYVVAIRRNCRDRGRTAADLVSLVPGVRIKGASDPNRVVIESSDPIEKLRSKIGEFCHVEPAIAHRTLGRSV